MQHKISNRTHSFFARNLTAIGAAFFALLIACPMASAQSFDLEAYLKKIDANKNGKMEESELGDRIKSYVVKIGLDPSKSQSIKKIMSTSKKYEKKSPSSKSKAKDSGMKVPGFGATTEKEREPVGVFGTSEEQSKSSGRSSSTKRESYSDSAMERANSTLARYDSNKNGSLDSDEIKKARWGSPSPEQSDLNKNGRLSRTELAKRYQSREQYYRGSSSRSSSNSSSTSSSSSKKAAEDRARREKDRSKYRSSYSSSSSSRSSRPSTTSSSSKSRTASTKPASSSSSKETDLAASRAKYEKYAKSFISGYDLDKDGKLNAEEMKKIRRPPVGADVNKDGFVTETELLDNLTGANKKKSDSGSTSTSSDSKRSKSSKYERKSSSKYSSRSSRNSSSFDDLDKNIDKQVQMHEFSDKWNDDKVAEFYAIDKNGDGMITLKEWSQRQR